ncbi:hypothetical protein CGK93_11150 [Arthrobacter sp. YN]|nr:hypothetical protein CGK93_11150 [Arthrobacter sp. YN]
MTLHDPSQRSRMAVLAGVISLALFGAFFALTIFYAMPSNVLAVKEGESLRRTLVSVAPQAWAFFTKPPNDPEYAVYQLRDDGSVESLMQTPQTRPENYFGLSRKQRSQGPELGVIGNTIKEWADCSPDGGRQECLERVRSLEAQIVDNDSPVASVCGRIVIFQTKAVPWAYREFESEARFEVKGAVVDSRCKAR